MTDDRVEWVEIVESKTKKYIYANLTTGQCVWDLPDGANVKKADDNQWWELRDPQTCKYYYYNTSTQKTVWNKPHNCDIIPLAKLQTIKQNTEVVAADASSSPPGQSSLSQTSCCGVNKQDASDVGTQTNLSHAHGQSAAHQPVVPSSINVPVSLKVSKTQAAPSKNFTTCNTTITNSSSSNFEGPLAATRPHIPNGTPYVSLSKNWPNKPVNQGSTAKFGDDQTATKAPPPSTTCVPNGDASEQTQSITPLTGRGTASHVKNDKNASQPTFNRRNSQHNFRPGQQLTRLLSEAPTPPTSNNAAVPGHKKFASVREPSSWRSSNAKPILTLASAGPPSSVKQTHVPPNSNCSPAATQFGSDKVNSFYGFDPASTGHSLPATSEGRENSHLACQIAAPSIASKLNQTSDALPSTHHYQTLNLGVVVKKGQTLCRPTLGSNSSSTDPDGGHKLSSSYWLRDRRSASNNLRTSGSFNSLFEIREQDEPELSPPVPQQPTVASSGLHDRNKAARCSSESQTEGFGLCDKLATRWADLARDSRGPTSKDSKTKLILDAMPSSERRRAQVVNRHLSARLPNHLNKAAAAQASDASKFSNGAKLVLYQGDGPGEPSVLRIRALVAANNPGLKDCHANGDAIDQATLSNDLKISMAPTPSVAVLSKSRGRLPSFPERLEDLDHSSHVNQRETQPLPPSSGFIRHPHNIDQRPGRGFQPFTHKNDTQQATPKADPAKDVYAQRLPTVLLKPRLPSTTNTTTTRNRPPSLLQPSGLTASHLPSAFVHAPTAGHAPSPGPPLNYIDSSDNGSLDDSWSVHPPRTTPSLRQISPLKGGSGIQNFAPIGPCHNAAASLRPRYPKLGAAILTRLHGGGSHITTSAPPLKNQQLDFVPSVRRSPLPATSLGECRSESPKASFYPHATMGSSIVYPLQSDGETLDHFTPKPISSGSNPYSFNGDSFRYLPKPDDDSMLEDGREVSQLACDSKLERDGSITSSGHDIVASQHYTHKSCGEETNECSSSGQSLSSPLSHDRSPFERNSASSFSYKWNSSDALSPPSTFHPGPAAGSGPVNACNSRNYGSWNSRLQGLHYGSQYDEFTSSAPGVKDGFASEAQARFADHFQTSNGDAIKLMPDQSHQRIAYAKHYADSRRLNNNNNNTSSRRPLSLLVPSNTTDDIQGVGPPYRDTKRDSKLTIVASSHRDPNWDEIQHFAQLSSPLFCPMPTPYGDPFAQASLSGRCLVDSHPLLGLTRDDRGAIQAYWERRRYFTSPCDEENGQGLVQSPSLFSGTDSFEESNISINQSDKLIYGGSYNESPSNTSLKIPTRTSNHSLVASSDRPKFNINRHKKGLFRKKLSIANMLSWSKEPIQEAMIKTDDKAVKKEAIEIFKKIQIYMGDKRVRKQSPANIALEIVNKGIETGSKQQNREDLSLPFSPAPHSHPDSLGTLSSSSPPCGGGGLRDEIFMQLCRQTTENPRCTSLKRGWELMCICLTYFAPSPAFRSYLETYCYQHLDPVFDPGPEAPIHRFAAFCLTQLQRRVQESQGPPLPAPASTGLGPGRGYTASSCSGLSVASRRIKKPLSVDDIERAKICIFKPSMFGNTLEEVMLIQASKHPQLRIPWIQCALSKEVLRLNGPQIEGIFRVPGDIDEVNTLKGKIDQWILPPNIQDPHVPASLLKLWYRELYDPLIPASFYEECIDCHSDPEKACDIVERLPEINRFVMCYLIKFLQIFALPENSALSKMDTNNLAMVMAPNCLRCQSEQPQVIFDNARKEMAFVRNLIQYLDTSSVDSIFP